MQLAFLYNTGVLKMAIETVVKKSFQTRGLFPLQRNAIDETKLIGDAINFSPHQDDPIPLLMECTSDSEGTIQILITKGLQ